MQAKQKKLWKVLSIVASLALILAIVGEALFPRGSIARAAFSEPAFKAHTIQATPIFHTLSTLQNVLPAHSRSGPKTVLYKCQREKDPRPVHCYGPYQIRQAYGVSDLLAQHFTGQGSTIAIIDAYGSPTIQKDLQAFDNAWGLPEANLKIIAPYGQPKADSDWIPETSLDVEWAHAMAPDATLNLLVAKSSNDVDLYNVTKYAVEHNLGDVLSLSFGENEKCADPALRKAEHTLFAQATGKGMTILAAAGDSGSAQLTCDGTSFEEAISFPAADPFVTAVGGTDLKADSVSGKYISETAWNESSVFNKATGGGYSTLYSQPAYQNGVTISTSGRAIPDISLNASVNGGVVAFDSDLVTGHITISIMGGTSVATPELAGIIADGVQMAHHRLGAINPALYKLGIGKDYSHLMYDITSGNNVLAASSIAGYPATRGWDPVTGWGTPQEVLPFLKNVDRGPGNWYPVNQHKTSRSEALKFDNSCSISHSETGRAMLNFEAILSRESHMSEPIIRILLCEDQTLMRQGLHTVLELEPGFLVVAEAEDGEQAVKRYTELQQQDQGPDVVLMDIQMPHQNGVQATAAITTAYPAARIIILTTFDYEDYVFDAVKAGAMGYLLKDVPATELAGTIRKVHAGEPFIQPSVASKLLMDFGRKGRATHSQSNTPLDEELSSREIEVLKLLAAGASNREIAERLTLAEGTIKNHVSNILSKLHAENRTQAANLARERKLI